jgi:hypothetical protein
MLWVAAIVLTVVGGAITAYGQYQAGQAQKKMYQYQSDVASAQQKMDQQAADANVKLTQYKASEDNKMLLRKYDVLEGSQKAAAAGMGMGGGSVSEGDIATDTFNTRNAEEQSLRWNADVKSWAIRNETAGEIWGLDTQINQYGFAGKSAARAGTTAAVGTIFSTAGAATGIGAMGAAGSAKSGVIQGGKGGTTSMNAQFGKVWSPPASAY